MLHVPKNRGRCDYVTLFIHDATRTAFKLERVLKDTITIFRKHDIISGNSSFNEEKAYGNFL